MALGGALGGCMSRGQRGTTSTPPLAPGCISEQYITEILIKLIKIDIMHLVQFYTSERKRFQQKIQGCIQKKKSRGAKYARFFCPPPPRASRGAIE